MAGLDAGNRLAIRFANPAVTSRTQLPDGKIVTTKRVTQEGGKYVTSTYDKTAFETDGSLICLFNAFKGKNITVKVKWTDGAESTYTIDITRATLAEEAS